MGNKQKFKIKDFFIKQILNFKTFLDRTKWEKKKNRQENEVVAEALTEDVTVIGKIVMIVAIKTAVEMIVGIKTVIVVERIVGIKTVIETGTDEGVGAGIEIAKGTVGEAHQVVNALKKKSSKRRKRRKKRNSRKKNH